MKQPHAIVLLTLLCCSKSCEGNDAYESSPRFIVIKCCKKGQQLDKGGEHCVQRPGWDVIPAEQDIIQLPMQDKSAYWVPSYLQNVSIVVLYGERKADWRAPYMDATDSLVQQLLNTQFTEHKFVLTPFMGLVNSTSVRNQTVCFDTLEDTPQHIVFVTSVYLRPLYKCCAKGEQLNWDTNGCDRTPGKEIENIREEILSPFENAEDSHWVPVQMRSSVVKALYGYRPSHQYNVRLNADTTSWRLLRHSNTYKLWVNSTGTTNPSGVSRFYCFDDVRGAPFSRIVMALVTHVRKCCGRGKVFSSEDSVCVTAYDTRESEDFEVINMKSDFSYSVPYWIPPKLRSTRPQIIVKYGDTWQLGSRAIFWANGTTQWNIEYPKYEESTLVLTIMLSSGHERTVRTHEFCFEVLADSFLAPRIIMADIPSKEVNTVFKCCPIGRRLSKIGFCESHSGEDWSPKYLTGSKYSEKPVVMNVHKLAYCRRTAFQVIRSLSEREFELADQFPALKTTKIQFCYDLQPTNEGENKGVLAYCNVLPTLPVYRSIRPLQVVAAVLLVGAVAAILRRENMRRSAHGLALAFHAACLMISNALQATWFFASNPSEECDLYAYSIYFFLIASALWLNAVAVNMAYGFRQPLGVLSRQNGDGWRRLVVLSVYSWGVTIAMTAFCICMDRSEEPMIEKGVITSSFYETRTCRFDQAVTVKVRAPEFISKQLNHDMGSLLYYYVPSALLVIANCVCLGLTWMKIRELREDSSLLESTSHPLRSSLLYVKLLLSAGVLDLVLELIAWSIRPRNLSKYDDFIGFYVQLMENALLFVIMATFVDLLRAVAVLWLCVGEWGWVSEMWKWLTKRLHWRKGPISHVDENTNMCYELTPKDVPEKNEESNGTSTTSLN